jgi:archaeal flagellin FlaB
MHKQQKGITGLETAIILIAFVVVAAVFAYTVLSAGLFSTQKSQEAVYSGLKETQSTLEILGSVVAYQYSDADIENTIGKVEYTVALASGGDSVDLTPAYQYSGGTLSVRSANANKLQIAYSDKNVIVSDMPWTVSFIGNNNADYLLEQGEKAVISVWLHPVTAGNWTEGASGTYLASYDLDKYQTFNLEVKPSSGAVLTIQRTTPAYLDTVIDLH